MIGIFGGTFDPVHHGHLRIALDAQEALGLEQVRLIPLASAVHREQPQATAEQRLAMLQAAVAGHTGLHADPREIERGGQSFMVDTIESLRNEFAGKRLCLLLGSDAFNGLPGWRDPERILAMAHVLVMQRPGYTLPNDPELQALVKKHRCNDVSDMTRNASGCVHFHTVTQLDISSSDIRSRIAAGTDPSFLLPDPVLSFIRQNDLYR